MLNSKFLAHFLVESDLTPESITKTAPRRSRSPSVVEVEDVEPTRGVPPLPGPPPLFHAYLHLIACSLANGPVLQQIDAEGDTEPTIPRPRLRRVVDSRQTALDSDSDSDVQETCGVHFQPDSCCGTRSSQEAQNKATKSGYHSRCASLHCFLFEY